jgi:methionine salvage enolase-phosphatase E1
MLVMLKCKPNSTSCEKRMKPTDRMGRFRHLGMRVRRLIRPEQVAELDAALDAGYDTCLCVRPGNRLQPHTDKHPLIRGFDDLV